MTKREALREIRRSATTWMVAQLAEDALQDGSERAMLHALTEARRLGVTHHVFRIAGEQLGYEPDDDFFE
jgi:hypothetical protein